MLLVVLCCQIGFLVQFVLSADTTKTLPADATKTPPADTTKIPSADTTKTPPADTTKTPPADTKKTPPADTTKAPPADTSQNATADTTQKAPADNSSIATADTTPKASTNSTKTEYAILQKLLRTSRDVPIIDQESNDSPMIEEVDNPDSGYGPWGEWTKCAKHCGVGRSTRERKCNDLDNCHDGNIEVRLCSRKHCKTDKPSG